MWILLALPAAMLWGVHYALSEQVFKHISVLTEIAFVTICSGIILGLVSFWRGSLAKDIATLVAQPRVLLWLVLSAGAFLVADLLISNSIVDKNATVASLVEISYPFFVALASYLIFSENNISIGTAVGGTLVFCGVAVIYAFNH